jgi:hypothetical protein
MSANVKVNLPSIDQAVKALSNKQLEDGMKTTAESVATQYRTQWSRARDAEGNSNPKLSDGYEKKKQALGRNPVADFSINGNFGTAFGFRKINGPGEATISWPAGGGKDGVPYLKKARGLMSPNSKYSKALTPGNKMQKIADLAFNKWLRKVVNFQ